jgi:hypothetical protein
MHSIVTGSRRIQHVENRTFLNALGARAGGSGKQQAERAALKQEVSKKHVAK